MGLFLADLFFAMLSAAISLVIPLLVRYIMSNVVNVEISAAKEMILQVGGLMIDYEKHLVKVDGQQIHLTQNEYKIVAMLGKCAGKVLTYDYILKELWGPGAKGNNQILRVNMANIRRKIEQNPAEPKYIFTEIGVGYRMVDPD